jgi:hypothetical protein
MDKMGAVIKTDGTLERLDLSVSDQELGNLQSAVGGYVQAIDLSDTMTMWMNEEGKLVGLPYNGIATALWEARFGVGTDVIMGNAVFTGTPDEDGETTTISESDLQRLSELVELVRSAKL